MALTWQSLSQDKNIFFLSADFGAAALDELREKFPNNFLHFGISEQAMLDIAAGLALEGNMSSILNRLAEILQVMLLH